MLSDEAMYARMKDGWQKGLPYTVCGNGSLPDKTASIRAWLPGLVKRHGIKSVNDAGAGDLYWIGMVKWDVECRPFDLIPRKPEVQQIDITTQAMPPADAILCRMVLNHLVDDQLDDTRVVMALERFRESARFLIATHFEGACRQRSPQFVRLNLTKWLGEPLESVRDGEVRCRLAIWDISG